MADFDSLQAQLYVEGHRLSLETTDQMSWLGVCRCALWTDVHNTQHEVRLKYFDHLRAVLNAKEEAGE